MVEVAQHNMGQQSLTEKVGEASRGLMVPVVA